MKTIYFLLMLIASKPILSQITYVDNMDIVYPYGNNTWYLDINNDGLNDISVKQEGSIPAGSFGGVTNTIGANRLQGTTVPSWSGNYVVDCTNDTINSFTTTWNSSVYLWKQSIFNIGHANHKQGFRLVENNTQGNMIFKYGYIDYTLLESKDIIVHGWYYDNGAHVPIVANTGLDYPFDGNCIHYDTVVVYDTIVTEIFDTVLVSVTDTLIIETTLSTSPLTQNTILVFPNPTNDHITINTGSFALMTNYSIKIENSLGQVVFTNPLNQQNFYVDLTGWSGNGIYYLKLLDAQNNVVTVRKVVLQ